MRTKAQKELDLKDGLQLIDSLYFYNVLTIGYESDRYKTIYEVIKNKINKLLIKYSIKEGEHAYYEHYAICLLEIEISYQQKKYNEEYLSNSPLSYSKILELDNYTKKYDISYVFAILSKKNKCFDIEEFSFFINDLFSQLELLEIPYYAGKNIVKKYHSFCYNNSSIDFYIYLNYMGILKSGKIQLKEKNLNIFIEKNMDFLIRTFLLLEFENIRGYLTYKDDDYEEIKKTTDFFYGLSKNAQFQKNIDIKEVLKLKLDSLDLRGIFLMDSDSYSCVNQVSGIINSYVKILSAPSMFLKKTSNVNGYFGKLIFLKYRGDESLEKNHTVEQLAQMASSFLKDEKGITITGKAIENRYQEVLKQEFNRARYYIVMQEVLEREGIKNKLFLSKWNDVDRYYQTAYYLEI